MTMSEWDSLPSSFSPLCQWSDSDLAVHLKDFSSRYALPNVVKVTKGQYRNIGVAKSVYNELYLHSIQTTPKVYAEGIKVKEGRRSVGPVEQRYAIPLTYEGWFELLSEDGRAVAPFYGVVELQQAFPASCLVRESVKAFLADDAGQINLLQPCVVSVGDQLTLIRNTTLPTPGLMGSSKKNYLCCRNMAGETLFVPSDQKGLFSPIAGQGNISGVHNIIGLLEKFRMPFKVRLVHGVVPGKMDRSFTGCFRFVSVFSDETAFVCPLKKDAKLVPVSLKEALKVVPVQNFDELRKNEECRYYDERSSRMTSNYLRSIHLLVTQPDVESVQKGQQELRRSLSASDAMTKSKKTNNGPDEDMLFSEIDEIYQYVRQGGIPPVPRTRPKSDGGTAVEVHSPKHKAVYVSSRSPHGTKERQHRPKQGHNDDEHYWEDPVYADITVFQKKPSRETDPRHKGNTRPRSKSETTLTALVAKHGDTNVKPSGIPLENSIEETVGTITFEPEPASDSDSAVSDKLKARGMQPRDKVEKKPDSQPPAPPLESMPTRSPLERSNSRSPSDNKPSMEQDKAHLSEQGKEQTESSPQQHENKQEPKGSSNVMNITRNSGPVANLRQLYRGIAAMKSNKDTEDKNVGGVVSQSYRKLSDSGQPRHSSSAEELSDKQPTQAGLPQSMSSPALNDRPQSPDTLPTPPDEPKSPPIEIQLSYNSLSLPVSKSPATSSGSPSLSKGSPVPQSSSPPSSPSPTASPTPPTPTTPTTPSPESTTPRHAAAKGERLIFGENDMLYKPYSPQDDGPERLVYGVTSKSSSGSKPGPEVLVYGQTPKHGTTTQSTYNLYRKSQDAGLGMKPSNGDRRSFSGFFGKKTDSRTITPSIQMNSRTNSSSNTIKVYNHYMPPRSPPVPIMTTSHDGTAKALNPGYNNRSSTYRSTPALYGSQYLSPTAAVSVAGQGNGNHPGYVAVARVDRDSGYGAPGSESPTPYEYSYNSLDRNIYNLHL